MVQLLPSLQVSIWQKSEQPSQLSGVPMVSQVSGNSTTPFPQTGQGTMQPGGVLIAVQVGRAFEVATGLMTPPVKFAGLRAG